MIQNLRPHKFRVDSLIDCKPFQEGQIELVNQEFGQLERSHFFCVLSVMRRFFDVFRCAIYRFFRFILFRVVFEIEVVENNIRNNHDRAENQNSRVQYGDQRQNGEEAE